MNWYRAVFDSEKLLYIQQCEHMEDLNGISHVIYVRAKSEEQARLLAQKERQKDALRARREHYVSLGKCRCGRDREDIRFAKCQKCRKRQSTYRKRSKAKERGENVEPLSKAVAYRERMAEYRLKVLLEVSKAWERSGTNGTFTTWLHDQIAELQRAAVSHEQRIDTAEVGNEASVLSYLKKHG